MRHVFLCLLQAIFQSTWKLANFKNHLLGSPLLMHAALETNKWFLNRQKFLLAPGQHHSHANIPSGYWINLIQNTACNQDCWHFRHLPGLCCILMNIKISKKFLMNSMQTFIYYYFLHSFYAFCDKTRMIDTNTVNKNIALDRRHNISSHISENDGVRLKDRVYDRVAIAITLQWKKFLPVNSQENSDIQLISFKMDLHPFLNANTLGHISVLSVKCAILCWFNSSTAFSWFRY